MTVDGIGSATTAQPFAVRSPQDRQARSWSRGASQVGREDLLDSARARLNRLMALPAGWDTYAARPVVPLAAVAAHGILTRLLFDDCPTPQIAPGVDGSIDIAWLVLGTSIEVQVAEDGEVNMWAEGPDGEELFDSTFTAWDPDDFALDQAKTYLNKMRYDIRHRVPLV